VYSELFETVPDALLVVDENGRIVLANRHTAKLFGYDPGAMVGQPVEMLIPPSRRARHHAHRAAYLHNPRVRPMGASDQTLIGQRSDGQQFPVEIALGPVTGADGQRLVLASIRDISESQRARQALVRARYDALAARLGQLMLESRDGESVIQSLPALVAEALQVDVVAVAMLQPENGRIAVRASVGLDAEQLAVRSSAEPSDDPLSRALRDGQPMVVDDLRQEPMLPGPIPLPEGAGGSIAVMPLLDRDHPMGALIATSRQPNAFAHDALHLLQSIANLLAALNQRRRTEEQLAHSQRLDAVGKLTGGVAHDFNNLLTIISGNLQLLESRIKGDPEGSDMIASALRASGRGAELTSKLLAFARRQRLTPQAVDPKQALGDIAEMMRRTLGSSIRIVVNDCLEPLPAAFADPTQLDSAMINLALNARDAMPQGGVITLSVGEVWVAARDSRPDLEPGHYIVFWVEDSGHGMSPDTLQRAIEPFFTTKDSGKGSGLGLSMVYGFVRQSGGSLLVESREGYGSRIRLYLPVARGRAAHVDAVTDVVSGHGQAIVVVEDDDAVRAIAVAFLTSLGYRIHSVGSSGEALRLLADGPRIDLLFSDVMLGDGMDGHALAAAAKSIRPGIAILMTSGYDDVASSDGRGDADAEPYPLLRKPYRREQLAAAVRHALGADA